MMKQKGFTIIELMVSTVVFSLVLLICLAGVLQVSKMYYKGVTRSRTQEAARSIIDEIAETIRFSSETITFQAGAPGSLVSGPEVAAGNPDTNYFCIGAKRYTYAIDRQLKNNPAGSSKEKRHVLWVDQPAAGCIAAANLNQVLPSNENGRELLSENMRLSRLDLVQKSNLNGGVYEVRLTVAYGDDTTQNDGPLNTIAGERICQGANASIIGEYCAVSNISVTLERRVQ